MLPHLIETSTCSYAPFWLHQYYLPGNTCLTLQYASFDNMYCLTICIVCQYVSLDNMHHLTICIIWQHVSLDNMYHLTKCISWLNVSLFSPRTTCPRPRTWPQTLGTCTWPNIRISTPFSSGQNTVSPTILILNRSARVSKNSSIIPNMA